MEEKLYKAITRSGTASLIAGITIIVCGIAAGVIAIISGARLLKARSSITF